MEIVECCPVLPWQESQAPPGELVSTVYLDGLGEPEENPRDNAGQMYVGEQAQQGDAQRSGQQVTEHVLQGVGVSGSQANRCCVLVVFLVNGVEQGTMEYPVGVITYHLVVQKEYHELRHCLEMVRPGL